ncbi:MAG: Maf family protein [Verrucomicrobiota bacterium]
MNLPTLILASASPRRSELLRQLDVDFQIIPSDSEEIHNEHLTAAELAQINAYRKARSVSKKFPDSLVLGVDTLVSQGSRLYGKPKDAADARRMLEELQSGTHEVVTGVCLIHLRMHRQRIFAQRTEVTFRSLSSEQIEHYHSKINPLDKAGGYAIQEHGDDIVRHISGSFSNVVGLPLERLSDELHLFVTEQDHAHA